MQKVEVLLATYNGSKYIEQQIESIFNQEVKMNSIEIHLTIRDDCSTDNTVEILDKLSKKFNISIIKDYCSLGFKNSFLKLIDNSIQADYYFFSDQDDIWKPNKVEEMILKCINKNVPTLVYSDLELFGTKTGLFSENMGIKHSEDNIKTLSLRNVVTGAAMMINKSGMELLKLNSKSLFSLIDYHDQLIGELFALCGDFVYIEEPLVLYRRHDSNVSGQKPNQSASRRLLISMTERMKIAKYIKEKDLVKKENIKYFDFINILACFSDMSYINRCLQMDVIGKNLKTNKHRFIFWFLVLQGNKF